MKSDSDKNNLAQNKVLILYILNRLEKGISHDGLFKIVSSANGLNYFYFQQTLNNLIETNLVGYIKDDKSVIKITSEGKNAYSLTKDVLPGLMKLKADNIFKKDFISIEEASSIVAEFIEIISSSNNLYIKIPNSVLFWLLLGIKILS